jgi:ABC-type sugar transport system substrate-binding protein
MGMRLKPSFYATLGVMLVLVIVVTGCGGGGSSTGADATTLESGPASADVAGAKSALAPYIGQFSPPFPVKDPLNETPSPDTNVQLLQLSTSYGGLLAELLEQAGDTAGVGVTVTKGGITASSLQSAAETILSQNPETVILGAADPSTFPIQLEEMNEKGITVLGNGIMEPSKYGIDGDVGNENQSELAGELMADWAVAKLSDRANVVEYEFPELDYSSRFSGALKSRMEAICDGCEVRVVPITGEEIGNRAAQTVVTDLQSHPETNQVIFGAPNLATGVPAALKAARLDTPIIVFGAEPSTLEAVKNGEVEAALTTSLGVEMWTLMDMALRSAQGMKLTPGEAKGITPMQFLSKKDITFNPQYGWSPDPEFMKTFATLWKVN